MINDDLTVSTFDRMLTDLLKHGHVLRKKKKNILWEVVVQ